VTPLPHTERRTPHRAALSWTQILDVFSADREAQLCTAPATEGELVALERTIGLRLPVQLREFLARIGAGLFYEGHEIFGPRRAMVHDIEMVPTMDGVWRREAAESRAATGLVPVHRARGVVHLIDASERLTRGRITTPGSMTAHDDFRSFLETIVIPREDRSGPYRCRKRFAISK
jgi:cell wall assembly regulator SMI1